VSNPGIEKKTMEKLMRDKNHMDKFEFFETEQQNDSDSDDDSKGKYSTGGSLSSSTPNPPNGSKKKDAPSSTSSSSATSTQRTQSASFSPPAQSTSNSAPPQLFDPFGFEPLPTSSRPQPSTSNSNQPFDPFGDPFTPINPSGGSGGSGGSFGTSQPSNAAFDPFGMDDGFSNTPSSMNAVPYDAKKKNIEMLFGSQPIAPVSTPMVPQQNNNTSSPFFPNQNTFGANPNPNPSFNPDPFGNNNAYQSGPFGSPVNNPVQQHTTFQPVTATGSNPFLMDNQNPFG